MNAFDTQIRHWFHRIARLLGLAGLLGSAAVAWSTISDPPRAARVVARVGVAMAGGTYLGRDGVVLQKGLADCGPAALANLLRTVGASIPSLDSLGRLAGTGAEGTRASGLIRAAQASGVSLVLRRVSPDSLEVVRKPFIAWVDKGHFVTVAEQFPDGRLVVLDPQVGRYSIKQEAFKAIWSGEAILLAGSARSPAAAVAAGLLTRSTGGNSMTKHRFTAHGMGQTGKGPDEGDMKTVAVAGTRVVACAHPIGGA